MTRRRRHGGGRGQGIDFDSHLLDALLEDVGFMAAHGATYPEAAARLGYTPKHLDKTLRRAKRTDLIDTLTANRLAHEGEPAA